MTAQQNNETFLDNLCGIGSSLHHFDPLPFVIKKSCSDFLVNEIGLDGLVVKEAEEVCLVRKEKEVPFPKEPQLRLREILEESEYEEIEALERGETEQVKLGSASYMQAKERRAALHGMLRSCLGPDFTSETSHQGDFILVRKLGKKGHSKDRRNLPKPPECLSFVLRKENVDTFEAIQRISKNLRLSPRLFSVAGSKDKRAITTQLVTAKQVFPERLASFNKIPRTGIRISGIQECEAQLQLGDLQGNKFVVVARDTGAFDLESRVGAIRERGFPNYFGRQRFGTQSVPTHHIGRELLRGDWKAACQKILEPRESGGVIQEMRLRWANGTFTQDDLKNLPHSAHAERKVMEHLLKTPNDCRGAVGAIGRDLRLMYVHAVQSYIWNARLSELIEAGEVLPERLCVPGYQYDLEPFVRLMNEFGLPENAFEATPQNETLWDLRGDMRTCLIKAVDLQGEWIDEERTALRLSFSLPPSCYATMLLRELFGFNKVP